MKNKPLGTLKRYRKKGYMILHAWLDIETVMIIMMEEGMHSKVFLVSFSKLLQNVIGQMDSAKKAGA